MAIPKYSDNRGFNVLPGGETGFYLDENGNPIWVNLKDFGPGLEKSSFMSGAPSAPNLTGGANVTLDTEDLSGQLQRTVSSLSPKPEKPPEQAAPVEEKQEPFVPARHYSERGTPQLPTVQPPPIKEREEKRKEEPTPDYAAGFQAASQTIPDTGSDLSGALTGGLSGASSGAMLSGGNPIAIALGGVIGTFAGVMGTRAKRKAAERLAKEKKKEIARLEKKAEEEKKEKRRQAVWDRKARSDDAAFANLQQALAAALNRPTPQISFRRGRQ